MSDVATGTEVDDLTADASGPGPVERSGSKDSEGMGIERNTFVLDEAGVPRAEWRKLKVKGHAAEVLETARGR